MSNDISLKSFTDTLVILVFFTKILIFSKLCEIEELLEEIIIFFRRYIYISLVAAILGTVFFYLLPQNSDAYAGLTPVVIPYLIYGLLNMKLFAVISAFSLIFLSGKRAIMLSAILVTVVSFVIGKRESGKKSKKIIYALLFIPLLVGAGYLFADSVAFDKIQTTFRVLNSIDDESLFRILGPRIYEVSSITNDMRPYDYIFGKGVGYTYDLAVGDKIISEGHANAHFSPVGLISKYGVIICFLMIVLISKALFRNSVSPLIIFLKLYVLAFLLESMFSYLIFNDRILPIVLGMLVSSSALLSKRNKKFV